MVTIETEIGRGRTGEFVLVLLACLALGFLAVIRIEIVRRLARLSALTAVIFAGLVIWLRP